MRTGCGLHEKRQSVEFHGARNLYQSSGRIGDDPLADYAASGGVLEIRTVLKEGYNYALEMVGDNWLQFIWAMFELRTW
jgi:hypothetical protein